MADDTKRPLKLSPEDDEFFAAVLIVAGALATNDPRLTPALRARLADGASFAPPTSALLRLTWADVDAMREVVEEALDNGNSRESNFIQRTLAAADHIATLLPARSH